jgi:hypothetical protein
MPGSSFSMQLWWPSGHSRWRHGEQSMRSESARATSENGGA